MEGALKTSFLQEANVKASNEDVWVENIAPGDDFFVDDLLDFSKDEVFNEEENEFVSVEEKQSESVDGVSVKDAFSELSVPADDMEMEQLEWLSQFVEDSELSHRYPEQSQNPFVKFKNPNQSVSVTEKSEILRAPVPGKPRSKRSRKGLQVWSLGSSSTHTETSNSSSSSSSSSGSGSSVSNPRLVFTPTLRNFDIFHSFNAPPPKKQKKRAEAAQVQRRCSHCGVQKTPQWRQGPHGAKTLCNACGVRYKSGRLLPEYRPACSPTFSSEVHSNNHRKVLEMRMKKETTARPDLVRRVQSF